MTAQYFLSAGPAPACPLASCARPAATSYLGGEERRVPRVSVHN